jgi:hypothetical protein
LLVIVVVVVGVGVVVRIVWLLLSLLLVGLGRLLLWLSWLTFLWLSFVLIRLSQRMNVFTTNVVASCGPNPVSANGWRGTAVGRFRYVRVPVEAVRPLALTRQVVEAIRKILLLLSRPAHCLGVTKNI